MKIRTDFETSAATVEDKKPRARRSSPVDKAALARIRELGQVWTPDWLADIMVAYALGAGASTLYDPAAGEGSFLRAAKRFVARANDEDSDGDMPSVTLRGCEIDQSAIDQAMNSGLADTDMLGVHVGDFMAAHMDDQDAICANPPYVRHHRISESMKEYLKALTKEIGIELDGRAGLHVYFLLKCLSRLAEGGRLAFLLPADTFEGIFARDLWMWISERFEIDGVLTFGAEVTPFPDMDLNTAVVFIRRASKGEPVGLTSRHRTLSWARFDTPTEEDDTIPYVQIQREYACTWAAWRCGRTFPSLQNCSASMGFKTMPRFVCEAVDSGFTRPPLSQERQTDAEGGRKLGDFAYTMRGVVTGANDFFLMTRANKEALGLPDSDFIRAVGRVRDVVNGETVTSALLDFLDAKGRPTYLLNLDGSKAGGELSLPLQKYLNKASQPGHDLSQRPFCKSRTPWFKMERRDPVPPIWFTYLGRRKCRFVKNETCAVPLSTFLCVYPYTGVDADILWKAISDPRTIAMLDRVGKSYGGGAIKVEPRALESLIIPKSVLDEYGLTNPNDEEWGPLNPEGSEHHSYTLSGLFKAGVPTDSKIEVAV